MLKEIYSASTQLEAVMKYIENHFGLKITELNASLVLDFVYKLYLSGFEFDLDNLTELDTRISEFILNNESYFFRFPEQLDLIVDYAGSFNHVNIVSFGCSRGEEPYSISIRLKELGISYKVYAFDIDKHELDFAENGVYRLNSIRLLSKEVLEYFDVENLNFKLKDDYKSNVEFIHFNFLQHSLESILGAESIDILVCNNVFIYLTDDAKKTAVGEFYDVLKPSGIFLTTFEEGNYSEIKEKFAEKQYNSITYFEKPNLRSITDDDYRDLFELGSHEVEISYREYVPILLSDEEISEAEGEFSFNAEDYERACAIYFHLVEKDLEDRYLLKLVNLLKILKYYNDAKKWLKLYLISFSADKNTIDLYLELCAECTDYDEYVKILERKVTTYKKKEDLVRLINMFENLGLFYKSAKYKHLYDQYT